MWRTWWRNYRLSKKLQPEQRNFTPPCLLLFVKLRVNRSARKALQHDTCFIGSHTSDCMSNVEWSYGAGFVQIFYDAPHRLIINFSVKL